MFDAQTLVVKSVLLALGLGLAYQVMAAAGALPAAEKALKKAARAGRGAGEEAGNRDGARRRRRGQRVAQGHVLEGGRASDGCRDEVASS